MPGKSGRMNISPSELAKGASHLGDLGDSVEAHGRRTRNTLGSLHAKAGRDKVVGPVLSSAIRAAHDTVGEFADQAQRVIHGHSTRLHASAKSHTDNEAETSRSFAHIDTAGSSRKRSRDLYEAPTTASSSTRTHPEGSYGDKDAEKTRLKNEFGKSVTGKDFESEHVAPYGAHANGLKRRSDGHAKYVENQAGAYYESHPAHRNHRGTGSSQQPDGTGFESSKQYQQTQRIMLESGRYGDAAQLNQLGYAHAKAFHSDKNEKTGARDNGTPDSYYTAGDPAKRGPLTDRQRMADDSYHHMVDSQRGKSQRYAVDRDAANDQHTNRVSPTDAAEMHLARDAARTGQWPSGEDQLSALQPHPPTLDERRAQALADGFDEHAYDPPGTDGSASDGGRNAKRHKSS